MIVSINPATEAEIDAALDAADRALEARGFGE